MNKSSTPTLRRGKQSLHFPKFLSRFTINSTREKEQETKFSHEKKIQKAKKLQGTNVQYEALEKMQLSHP
jgi:hypothetical protein